MDVDRLADAMLAECSSEEQSVRRIPDDAEADAVRARVRLLARASSLRIRTARMGDAVTVVRLDAAVWHEDAATMRAKLAPHD